MRSLQRKKFGFFIFLCCVFFFLPRMLLAETQNPQEILVQAEADFKKGEYNEAFTKYLRLVEDKQWNNSANTSALFYNIATAAFKAGKFGWSQVYFLKARSLNPFDADTAYNSNFLQKKLSAAANYATALLGSPLDTLSNTPPDIWLLTLMALIFIALLNYVKKKRLDTLSLFFFLLALFAAFPVAFHYYARSIKNGYIITEELIVRSGPGDTFPEIVSIGQGSSVQIKEFNNGWYKIAFFLPHTNNKKVVGWSNAASVYSINDGR